MMMNPFHIHKNRFKSWLYSLLFLLVLGPAAIGQQKLESNRYLSTSLLSGSPTTAAFKVFGDIPVSQFTGTPDITVPLHEVAYKELSVDLSLRYHHAIGSKPDAFPGPTGNGWAMNTGVITRISRGTTPSNFLTPVPVGINPTADADWSSNTKMQNYLKTQTIFVNDNGRYDEYEYSFGGTSGKFYIDHTDAFRIKTAQGEDILVEKDPALSTKNITLPTENQTPTGCTNSPYTNIITAKDFTYRFVLTDSRGVKYIFGGKDEAIEFTRPGMTFGEFDVNDQNTIPTSWYLTAIESPNGYKIDLNYTRGKFFLTNERALSDKIITPPNWAGNQPGYLNAPSGKRTRSTMYHPCHLDEIVTPISKVKFNWSIANEQLGYDITVSNCTEISDNGFIYFYAYPQVKDASMAGRFPNKLDNFVVSTSLGNRRKKVEFTYTNSTTTRLKLLSVKLRGDSDTPQNYPVYSFTYNTALPLPAYLSFKTDSWGYYNNKGDQYMSSSDPIYYYDLFRNAADRQLYLDSRQPDPAYTQAEILTKITYPTGGYTQYEYENNEYGRVAKFWPASISENPASASNYTGGLRIKRITNYDYAGHKATEKEYFYRKDFATGGVISSGVLSFEPRHYAYFSGAVTAPARWAGTGGAAAFTGNMTYLQYSSDALNIGSARSSHITYSEVTEKDLDGSFTVYKFKNYDNGYHDNEAENYISDNANVGDFWKDDEMNSLEIERGQLLSEEKYNSSNTLKQSVINTYNTSATRFDNHVRRIKLVPNPIFSANYPSIRYTASLVYTYFPYLESKTVTNYESGGNFVNAQTYVYNEQYRTLSSHSKTDSKGQTVLVSKKYPHDYPADATSLAMKNIHMVAPELETVTSVGGTQVNLTRTKYHAPHPGIYVPEQIQVQNGANPIEVRQQFTQYDSRGALLEQQKPGDVKEVYLWGYKSQYLMAKILGIDYATANAASSPSVFDGGEINELIVPVALQNLRNSLALSDPTAQVTTYDYFGSSMKGVYKLTDPNNKQIEYQYDALGRLSNIKNAGSGLVRASYCYNYAGQPTDCVALSATGSISASGLVLIAEPATPLPVKLINFDAVKAEKTSVLNWSTSEEVHSDYFDIERSTDGKRWIKLGTVIAHGTTNEVQNYTFTDKAPIFGSGPQSENLYRIKMVDQDGTFAYSRIKSVVFDKEGLVSFYPNPVTVEEKLNFSIEDISKVSTIQIFDSGGKLVHKGPAARQINTSNLGSGLYMVHVTYTDGSMSTHRIVKQ